MYNIHLMYNQYAQFIFIYIYIYHTLPGIIQTTPRHSSGLLVGGLKFIFSLIKGLAASHVPPSLQCCWFHRPPSSNMSLLVPANPSWPSPPKNWTKKKRNTEKSTHHLHLHFFLAPYVSFRFRFSVLQLYNWKFPSESFHVTMACHWDSQLNGISHDTTVWTCSQKRLLSGKNCPRRPLKIGKLAKKNIKKNCKRNAISTHNSEWHFSIL